MQKVIIIGSPGSGKSTLSRKLQKCTGLPLWHLDNIWHKLDRTTVSREEFDEKLAALLTNERWIIDGNYSRTLEMRLQACDTVILLDYPTEVCLAGAAGRVGTKRDDIPWVEEEFDSEFRSYIETFAQTRLPLVYALLEKYEQATRQIVLHSRAEADAFIAQLAQKP